MQRRHLLVRAALTPLVTLALPAAPRAQTSPFDSLLRQRAATDGVGFAAFRVQGGALQFSQAGVMRQGGRAPVGPQTLFELGSITKVFTSLLLADAVLAGRVRLDDAVEAVLPDGVQLRDSDAQPIRFIDLATHRSGLPRMPGNLQRGEDIDPYAGYDEARLLGFLRDWQARVARQKQFVYSNLGFGLLGYALTRIARQSLDQLLAERVLRPLGLADMRLRRSLTDEGGIESLMAAIDVERHSNALEATGHDARRQPVAPWHFDVLAGACGLLGSAASLGRFAQAALGQFDHPLKDAFAFALQRRAEGEQPSHPIGLAWELSPVATPQGIRMLYDHDGATGGFSSSLWLDPTGGRACGVLANALVETRSAALQGLAPELTMSMVDPPLPILPPVRGAPSRH